MVKMGDLVKFIGCSQNQIMWGNNDDPNTILSIGSVYKISKVDIHSSHTKISLKGITGWFNSVCFDTL